MTPSSLENLKPFYTEKDWDSKEEASALSLPGVYPYTRGIRENMYRDRLWTMRQYAGFGSAKESNKRYLKLLSEGSTGLSVAFDLPTQMGYDSDHVMASGEVGRVGVAVSSIEDMELLFKNISLEKVSTSMTINSTASILLAFYIALARRRNVPLKNLRGTVQNDLLKEYIARGTYIYPPLPSLRLTTDIFEFCSKEVPQWNIISISGYHIREAGSTASQELGFTLANAITYVEFALKRGLDIDSFGKRLSFFFNVQNNFFEEIAKFRVARRMWAKLMKERFGAKNPKATQLRFHSQTAGASLTSDQLENNIVRVTLQAFAAILGGTQSLHTNSMDEAIGLPTEKAAMIALRTQQILAFESGVTDVVDPLGGSFYLESLSRELEKKAYEFIHQIEDQGGVISCIEKGFIQKKIEESAYQFHKEVEKKERLIVGVNEFKEEESKSLKEVFRVSQDIAQEQIQRLKDFKKKRNKEKLIASLQAIEKAAASQDNLMPLFVDAVDIGVTLGEISDTLRKVFGELRA